MKIGPSGGLDNLPTQFSFLVPGPSSDFLGVNSISSFAQPTKTYVAAGGAIDFEVFATSNQTNAGFGIDSCELDISAIWSADRLGRKAVYAGVLPSYPRGKSVFFLGVSTA